MQWAVNLLSYPVYWDVHWSIYTINSKVIWYWLTTCWWNWSSLHCPQCCIQPIDCKKKDLKHVPQYQYLCMYTMPDLYFIVKFVFQEYIPTRIPGVSEKKYGVADSWYFKNGNTQHCNILWHNKYSFCLVVCKASTPHVKYNLSMNERGMRG